MNLLYYNDCCHKHFVISLLARPNNTDFPTSNSHIPTRVTTQVCYITGLPYSYKHTELIHRLNVILTHSNAYVRSSHNLYKMDT